MAAAFFNTLADPARAHAISAGTRPGTAVHPEVVTAMRELGIDLSAAKPQYLSSDLTKDAHIVITMGCGDDCPLSPASSAMNGRWTIRKDSQWKRAAHPGRNQEESDGVGQRAEVEIVESKSKSKVQSPESKVQSRRSRVGRVHVDRILS